MGCRWGHRPSAWADDQEPDCWQWVAEGLVLVLLAAVVAGLVILYWRATLGGG